MKRCPSLPGVAEAPTNATRRGAKSASSQVIFSDVISLEVISSKLVMHPHPLSYPARARGRPAPRTELSEMRHRAGVRSPPAKARPRCPDLPQARDKRIGRSSLLRLRPGAPSGGRSACPPSRRAKASPPRIRFGRGTLRGCGACGHHGHLGDRAAEPAGSMLFRRPWSAPAPRATRPSMRGHRARAHAEDSLPTRLRSHGRLATMCQDARRVPDCALWHGDAADLLTVRPLAYLADLVALQAVDLVADAIGRARDENQEMRPFDDHIATRRPGRRRRAKPKPFAEGLLHLEAARPER